MMRVAPHRSPVRCSEDGHAGSARQASVDPSAHAPSSLSVGSGVVVESVGIVVDSLAGVVESPLTDVVVVQSLGTDVVESLPVDSADGLDSVAGFGPRDRTVSLPSSSLITLIPKMAARPVPATASPIKRRR
jgi:hypothetical protein